MKFNRIYINSALDKNSKIELTGDNMHYLKTVLRLKITDRLRVFNGIDGEFIAQITEIARNSLSIKIIERLRKVTLEPSLTLAISIIKMDKLLLAINMAVQLGVTKIIPLITERGQFRSVNTDRLLKCVIEATEQCERLTPPIIEPATLISNYLACQTQSAHVITAQNLIIYANEKENKNNILTLGKLSAKEIIFIVGPEGGFTNDEFMLLASYSNTRSISLGTNILRAETAVAAGLAQLGLLRL